MLSQSMTMAGLELAIFGPDDQRVIHEATGPLVAFNNPTPYALPGCCRLS
jgi:hypothetical protein